MGMCIQIEDYTCLYVSKFADDTVICTDEKEGLECLAQKLIENYETWGLQE